MEMQPSEEQQNVTQKQISTFYGLVQFYVILFFVKYFIQDYMNVPKATIEALERNI